MNFFDLLAVMTGSISIVFVVITIVAGGCP